MENFIELSEVVRLTALNRFLIEKLIKISAFPTPVAIDERSNAWIAAEIYQWCDEQYRECYQNRTIHQICIEDTATDFNTLLLKV